MVKMCISRVKGTSPMRTSAIERHIEPHDPRKGYVERGKVE